MSGNSNEIDNGEVKEYARRLGITPEEEIDDDADFMFGGLQRAQSGSNGIDRELERDFIEPDSKLAKSRLSETQTVGIPTVELLVRAYPEFTPDDENRARWFIDEHLESRIAIDGKGRSEFVEILTAAVKSRMPGSGEGNNWVLANAGDDENND